VKYLDKLDLALSVAERLLGKPYIWGGDNPGEGFDCSGFVIEVLKSCGILPRSGDWTAHDLMNKFADSALDVPRAGCLIFWGNSGRATHVEMVCAVLDGTVYTIGASGGGSRTQSAADAVRDDAYIKIRPAKSNSLAVVNPFT